MSSPFSRRQFFSLGLQTAAAGALAPVLLPGTAHADGLGKNNPGQLGNQLKDDAASVENAITFQNRVMDAYATGSTVRLMQSYSDQALGATGFTYDNAVSIHAYLAHGTADSLARAQVLGDGLLYAQATNFPFNDGRFAQGYYVNVPAGDGSGAYVTPAAFPFYFYTSAVGDQAWAGMALTQLYLRTGKQSYLDGALKVANWIVTNCYSTEGFGGYSFGTNINQYNQSVPSGNGKSTEHNIDTYAFFTMLDGATKGGWAASGSTWRSLAAHALAFVQAMYYAPGPYFWTGTVSNAGGINYYPVPEDVQTWSYLALLDRDYAGTIDWALAHLTATDTASAPHSSLTGSETFTGLVFDTASLNTTQYDPQAVWLEGTSHGAAALVVRSQAGINPGAGQLSGRIRDIEAALQLLANCRAAQAQLGAGQTFHGVTMPVGLGLVASTSVMDTGFGYTYGPSLHIGATGWYLVAALGANPFQAGYRSMPGR